MDKSITKVAFLCTQGHKSVNLTGFVFYKNKLDTGRVKILSNQQLTRGGGGFRIQTLDPELQSHAHSNQRSHIDLFKSRI
jgi:hypothetical protein